MNKTLVHKVVNNHKYNILTLPGTNLFKIEIVNLWGAYVERAIEVETNKNIYGLSHLVEHLGFRSTKDFTTPQLMKAIKSEGNYNASTDHSRINYWFKTTTDRAATAVKLACNFTFNDLTTIPVAEFETERKVVMNEINQYNDDDQTMFHFNTTSGLCNLHKDDNILGDHDVIGSLTLDDAISLKKHFLGNGEHIFNITYDPMKMTEEQAIALVESEVARFETQLDPVPYIPGYTDNIVTPIVGGGSVLIENESEQSMTTILMDVVNNLSTSRVGNAYLSSLAPETSLNDVIREQNGLTYGISFSDSDIAFKNFTSFSCDVSKGTEQLLVELFGKSIDLSAKAYTPAAHTELHGQLSLKRSMAFVNQERYDYLLSSAIWESENLIEFEDIFAVDVDAGTQAVIDKNCTFDRVSEYLSAVQQAALAQNYTRITNYDVL